MKTQSAQPGNYGWDSLYIAAIPSVILTWESSRQRIRAWRDHLHCTLDISISSTSSGLQLYQLWFRTVDTTACKLPLYCIFQKNYYKMWKFVAFSLLGFFLFFFFFLQPRDEEWKIWDWNCSWLFKRAKFSTDVSWHLSTDCSGVVPVYIIW